MIHLVNVKTGEKTTREWTAKELSDMQAARTRDMLPPLEQWKINMAEYDNDMPRYIEEHIKNHHGGITGDPYTQTRYDEKTALRAQKPE